MCYAVDTFDGSTRDDGTKATIQHPGPWCLTIVRRISSAISRSASPRLWPRALSDARSRAWRSEEHTSELPSLMSISYAVFCLKKKTHKHITITPSTTYPNQHTN